LVDELLVEAGQHLSISWPDRLWAADRDRVVNHAHLQPRRVAWVSAHSVTVIRRSRRRRAGWLPERQPRSTHHGVRLAERPAATDRVTRRLEPEASCTRGSSAR